LCHDNWYSNSTQRLLTLIEKYKIPGILLSGDVHLAEILHLPCSKQNYGYDIYEVTSSGLTHTSRDHWPQGELFDKISFPETYNRGQDRFVDLNFGTIEVTWSDEDINKCRIRVDIRNVSGDVVLYKDIQLGELQHKESIESCQLFDSKEIRFFQHVVKQIIRFEFPLVMLIFPFGILLFLYLIYRVVRKVVKRNTKSSKLE